MPTPTEVANLALSHIGIGKEIARITEDSQEAKACNRYFETALKQTLRDFPWPFARVFEAAALVEENPTTEWYYSYRYPSTALKLRRILSGIRNDNRQSRIPYRIGKDAQGKLIYTDQKDACYEYIELVTDTSAWPDDAAMALSFRLGAYIAPRLTGGDPFKVGDRAIRFYLTELNMAKNNAINEQQDEENPLAEWTRDRDAGESIVGPDRS